MTGLVILHGNKLNKDGSLSSMMLERIDVLKDLLKQDTEISLVICGGKTRKKLDSEAKTIFLHMTKSGLLSGDTKILIEEESRTTAQNILEIKKLLKDLFPMKIKAITTKESVPRFKYLYKKLWPEINSEIEFCTNKNSRKILGVIEQFYFWYTHVDPEYKWLKIPVRIFRNG